MVGSLGFSSEPGAFGLLAMLLGSLAHLDGESCGSAHHDEQIKEEGRIPHVFHVHHVHLAEGRLILTVHLPVSGEAGKGVKALPLPFGEKDVFLWEARARTDEAHFSAQDVEQLR